MDWKQPEGLRRHWTLEELDAEILFLQMPVNAAQGRVGDDVYDLRDGGVLRKCRTLASGGSVIATLEEKAAGSGGTLQYGGRDYNWKSTNLMNTRWVLTDSGGKTIFTSVAKPGLAKVARIELEEPAIEGLGILVLLCWYVTVL